jgi:hypothetical protein
MSEGAEVWGAASTGALHAAELHELGMKGVGRIFRLYRRNYLTDDGEVCVEHAVSEQGYMPLPVPVINLRFTLQLLSRAKIISTQVEQKLIDLNKEIFFASRTWPRVMEIIRDVVPRVRPQDVSNACRRCYFDAKRINRICSFAQLNKRTLIHQILFQELRFSSGASIGKCSSSVTNIRFLCSVKMSFHRASTRTVPASGTVYCHRAARRPSTRVGILSYRLWVRFRYGAQGVAKAGSLELPAIIASLRQHQFDTAGRAVHARLLYSARAVADVIYHQELQRLSAEPGGPEVNLTLTREPPPDGLKGFDRRIDASMLAAAGVAPEMDPDVFVCGPTPMEEAVANALVGLGHEPARIRTERFGPTGER